MNGNTWQCDQCTFSNHPDLNSCELCNYVPKAPRNSVSSSASSAAVTYAVTGIVDLDSFETSPSQLDNKGVIISSDTPAYSICGRCSYHNETHVDHCQICGDIGSFSTANAVNTDNNASAANTSHTAFTRSHGILSSGRRSMSNCPRCHVSFNSNDDSSNNYGNSESYSSYNNKFQNKSIKTCPTCDFDLTTGQNTVNYPSNYPRNDPGNYSNNKGSNRFYKSSNKRGLGSDVESITTGLIELISENLSNIDHTHSKNTKNTKMEDSKSKPLPKKITVEFALCSACPHISQKGFEGKDWSCGYRNIQMLCHSLLMQSDSENDYKSVLFNGKGER